MHGGHLLNNSSSGFMITKEGLRRIKYSNEMRTILRLQARTLDATSHKTIKEKTDKNKNTHMLLYYFLRFLENI